MVLLIIPFLPAFDLQDFINPHPAPFFPRASFKMATRSYFWIYSFVVCLLARSGLSVPATVFSSVRTATTQIGSGNHAVSSLDIVPTLDITSARQDVGVKYIVPNTYVMFVKYFL